MKDFVLDCSVAISWILPDEYSDYAEKILTLLDKQQAVVPSIWYLEIANVLIVSERRERMTQAQTKQALSLLKSLDIVIDLNFPHTFVPNISQKSCVARFLRSRSPNLCVHVIVTIY